MNRQAHVAGTKGKRKVRQSRSEGIAVVVDLDLVLDGRDLGANGARGSTVIGKALGLEKVEA